LDRAHVIFLGGSKQSQNVVDGVGHFGRYRVQHRNKAIQDLCSLGYTHHGKLVGRYVV
jgi:hypothetical protein